MTRLLQRLWDRLVPLRDDWASCSRLDRADGLRDPDDLDQRIQAQRDAANQARRTP